MPVNLTKENANVGDVVYHWQIKEYDKVSLSKRWYLVAAVVFGLLLFYAMAAANYIFILILALFGIILFLHSAGEPVDLDFVITETGIVLGKKFYRFRELENFWLIYNPPEVKKIYFALNGVLKHRLQVPLLDNDPRPIREFLSQYLQENLEEQEEPLSDKLARFLKIG